VPFLGARPRDPVRPRHVSTALVPRRQQVQAVLVQPAQQLPAPILQLFLQVSMPQLPGLLPGQPRLQLPVIRPGLRERPARRLRRVPLQPF
jgi:hypothetical protein